MHAVALKGILHNFSLSTISPGSDGAPSTILPPASLLHQKYIF
jgi:hypothetical protein